MKEESIVKFDEVIPSVFVFENIINNPQKLIDIAINEASWEHASLGPSATVNKNIRNNKRQVLLPSFNKPKEWFDISQKVWQYGDFYAKFFEIGFSEMEPLQMLHYNKGVGFYKPHSDSGPGHERLFSAVLYLNTIKNGGGTYFNKFNFEVSPEAGKLVLFPANYAYMHEARVSPDDDKFVIVTWFKPEILQNNIN
jgi:hypothetical protein